MATTEALMALGMGAELAKRVGYEPGALTTTATATQGSGALIGPGNKIVALTSHSNTGSVTLPTAMEQGDQIVIENISANTANLYPPTGGIINGNSANAAYTIEAAGSAGCAVTVVKTNASTSAPRFVVTENNDQT
jgi:hypothetical protein